jgi:hypothetical protein
VARRWVGAVVGLVLLGGCGGPAGGTAAAGTAHYADVHDLVTAVAARQRADGTAKMALRGQITGTAVQRFTGEGVLHVGGDGVSVRYTQVVTQKGAAPQETGFVLLPGRAFLRVAGADPQRPWTRVDPGSTDPAARRLVAMVDSVTDTADPTATLARYADVTTIVEARDDVVEGDPVVRYTLAVDLARAAAVEPDVVARDRLQQQVRAGLGTVTSTLWIDPEGRPVRTAARQDLPGVGTLDLLGSYRDWGRPVQIDPPPEALVQ